MSPALHLSFGAVDVGAGCLPAGHGRPADPHSARLADQHGRVRFYLIGTAVFTAGSLLAALSMSGAWLIVSRVVQGGGRGPHGAPPPPPSSPPCSRRRSAAAPWASTSWPCTSASASDRRWAASSWTPWAGAGSSSSICRSASSSSCGAGSCCRARERVAGRAARRLRRRGPARHVPHQPAGAAHLRPGVGMGGAAHDRPARALRGCARRVRRRRAARGRRRCSTSTCCVHNRLFAAANTAALLNYMALFAISVLTAIFLQVVQGRSASLTGRLHPQPAAAAWPCSARSAGRLSDRIGSRVLATGGMVGHRPRHGPAGRHAHDRAGVAGRREPGYRGPRHGGLQRAQHLRHHGQRAARPAQRGERLHRDHAHHRAGAQRGPARRHRRQSAGARGRAGCCSRTGTAPEPPASRRRP